MSGTTSLTFEVTNLRKKKREENKNKYGSNNIKFPMLMNNNIRANNHETHTGQTEKQTENGYEQIVPKNIQLTSNPIRSHYPAAKRYFKMSNHFAKSKRFFSLSAVRDFISA